MIRLSRLSTRETTTFIFKSTFVSKRFRFEALSFLFFFVTPTVCCVFLNDIKKNIKRRLMKKENGEKAKEEAMNQKRK